MDYSERKRIEFATEIVNCIDELIRTLANDEESYESREREAIRIEGSLKALIVELTR